MRQENPRQIHVRVVVPPREATRNDTLHRPKCFLARDTSEFEHAGVVSPLIHDEYLFRG